ncbi:MAG: hypothetical protein OXG97_03475 [Candidatus Poribacteria bacterium]|nr:hypothetical protein [Candidatus Poribacteria bacterium]
MATEIGTHQTYFSVSIETFFLEVFYFVCYTALIGSNITWVSGFRLVSIILMDRNRGV